MVQDQVDPRARRQRGKLLQKLEQLEKQMTGAVSPQQQSMMTSLARFSGQIVVVMLVTELLLRLVHWIYPLERPSGLDDTYQNEWLEGGDWFNGLTRLYIYKPNQSALTYGHPFSTNRWGFRGHDFLDRRENKAERSSYRIMVLGDSITAGTGIAEADRYTEVLEHKLQGIYPHTNIEVINLGVAGFETVQVEKIMRRMWDIVRPDLVVVGFCRNDPNITYSFHPPFKIPMPWFIRRILESSMVFRQAEEIYDPVYRTVKGFPRRSEYWRTAYNVDSNDWGIFVQRVQSIARWTEDYVKYPPVVVYLADVQDGKSEGIYWPIRETFTRSGFIWSEMAEGNRYKPVSRFEGHPNEETHRAFAQALFDTITAKELVPREAD